MPTLLNGSGIPKLIYGTTWKGSDDLLFQALVSGFCAFDTASTRKYHREDIDGQQLHRALLNSSNDGRTSAITRDAVLIQTKFTPSHEHIDPKPFHDDDDLFTMVLKSLERSLDDLGVDIIDVYMLHGPIPKIMTVWTALEIAVRVGKVRYLGICNVDEPTLCRLHKAAEIKPAFVQNRYKRDNGFDINVRKFCAENRIVYETFGVLGPRNSDLLQLAPVKLLAEQCGCSLEEALLQIVSTSGAVEGLEICILTGTTRLEQMRRDIELVAKGNANITPGILTDYAEALRRISADFYHVA